MIRHSYPEDGRLTPRMLADYARDGFLVLDNFADAATCARLRGRITELIEGFDPNTNRVAFSSGEQKHAAMEYFRTSGDKVRFFVEEGAVDENGALNRHQTLAVNKIGHALHDLDPVFSAFSRDPRLAETAADLGLADPVLAQSMVICKQPRIGGEVGMHQDATFLYTDPVSVTGFWVALEAADRENGCLFAAPGGHKGPLTRRFRYYGADLLMDRMAEDHWEGRQEVALEAPEGTLVILHGLAPHRSGPNHSERSRLAYALHAVDRAARWSADNWLRRAVDMPMRGFDD